VLWNVADLFEGVCDAVPDREAIVCGDRRLTFRDFDERATRLAHHLLAQGVQAGDHVGLYLYNGSEYMEATLAAYKIRAVPINVNYRYVESELRYLFDNADLVALVHGREFVPRIAAVRDELPKLKVFVSVEDGTREDLSSIGAVEYEAALDGASSVRDFAPRSEDDLYILYTGGTTGMPKGVMWTQRDYLLSTIVPLLTLGGPLPEAPDAVVEIARNGGFNVSFPIPPLMHGAALWVATMTLMGGNKLVLSSEHKLDPRAVWSTVEREKVLSVTLVGDAMARPLIEALDEPGADFDTSSLVILGSGGAILSPAVKAKINATLPNVVVIDSIGASETGYQGTFIQADDQGHPRFQMGEHTTVLDDDGNPVEPGSGVVGRLARGGFVPLGYYKDPEKTASVFVESADGRRWVLPGDMAMVEADGTIALLGRGSVSINSGGEKIFPEEVESALKSHPDVFDAVVVGVPDERWGERVAAVIKPRPGASPSLDELAAHVREQIAGYKVPKEVHLVDEVVRSPSGKADYRWAKATATAAQR
jgi:acyl-CoA synthetase (AMP-forming)/AMP-acid ligase II